jgi:UDP-N-acetylmuramate--alanine ligase
MTAMFTAKGDQVIASFRNFQQIHLVGIGGSGMSGIAEVLLSSHYAISGSDRKLSPVTERLRKLGAKIFEGHQAENVHGAHVVVISSAVRADNLEVIEAHRLKIPVIPRAEMLAELMRLKYGIAVAGAHGKTTTTSMVAAVLDAAGLDPTFVVGGRVNHAGSHAGVGQSEYMVVEADESDRSFLLLAPVVAVITTIDREHLDHYHSLEEIQDVFLQFANRVPFYGKVILCLDEPNVQAILPRVKRPIITYGTSHQADLMISEVRLHGLSSDFSLKYQGEDLGTFRLPSPPGIHNVRNATAAAGVALSLNVPPDLIRAGLANFGGVGRRFEIKGKFNGVTLIDDYGHHPAEIRATLEAARLCGYRRLLVLFQPHRYTRTQQLWEEFRSCFNQADIVAITDIYPAGEQPIDGITAEKEAAAISSAGHKHAVFTGTMQAGVELMLREARPGDAVLAIGAGSIGRALDQLAVLLESKVTTSYAG